MSCTNLPERDRPPIRARMRRAWRETDYPRALEQLTQLAHELDHPPGRRRLASRGDGGDADRDPARIRREAATHARVHEPVRIDDRLRSRDAAQRQALVPKAR